MSWSELVMAFLRMSVTYDGEVLMRQWQHKKYLGSAFSLTGRQ